MCQVLLAMFGHAITYCCPYANQKTIHIKQKTPLTSGNCRIRGEYVLGNVMFIPAVLES